MIIDEIKKQSMIALKEKDSVKRGILGVVVNKYTQLAIELKSRGEEISDDDTIRILTKVKKELDEELNGFIQVNNQEKINTIMHQKEVIKIFLPAMLSEEEIEEIIRSLDDKSIPSIMKHFKANYSSKADMSLVNKVAREFVA